MALLKTTIKNHKHGMTLILEHGSSNSQVKFISIFFEEFWDWFVFWMATKTSNSIIFDDNIFNMMTNKCLQDILVFVKGMCR